MAQWSKDVCCQAPCLSSIPGTHRKEEVVLASCLWSSHTNCDDPPPPLPAKYINATWKMWIVKPVWKSTSANEMRWLVPAPPTVPRFYVSSQCVANTILASIAFVSKDLLFYLVFYKEKVVHCLPLPLLPSTPLPFLLLSCCTFIFMYISHRSSLLL